MPGLPPLAPRPRDPVPPHPCHRSSRLVPCWLLLLALTAALLFGLPGSRSGRFRQDSATGPGIATAAPGPRNGSWRRRGFSMDSQDYQDAELAPRVFPPTAEELEAGMKGAAWDEARVPRYLAPIVPSVRDMELLALHEAEFAKGPRSYLSFVADSPAPLPAWRPLRARPIRCKEGDYYSGYFSVPEENFPGGRGSFPSELYPPNQTAFKWHWQAFFDEGNHRPLLDFARAPPTTLVLPRKTKDWGIVVPGIKRTYVFKREEDYQLDYVGSRFAVSKRRLGWATNRNLEMMAVGCVPYFCGIDRLPPTGALRSLPLLLLKAIPAMPGLHVRCGPHKKHVWPFPLTRADPDPRRNFNETLFTAVAQKAFDYTQQSMVTQPHALYVLSATSLRQLPRRVLVVWASHYSIMLTGVVHGLRRLGVEVEDIPRRAEVYNGEDCNSPEAKARKYAGGYFFFCRATESTQCPRATVDGHDAEVELRSQVRERLRQGRFDLALLSVTDNLTYHMTDPRVQVPLYTEVVEHLPRGRILLMNDADLLRPMQADVAHRYLHDKGLYFKRETHGCHEPIW